MFGHPTLFAEVSLVIIFLLTCRHAAQHGRRGVFEVVSAAVYGLLLEEGDILIFDSYFYSDDFVLAIDRVPIAIALAWAVIIYSCMRLSDAFGLSRRVAPFADAIWTIAIDFALDAVAIRMGYWQWTIDLNEGYFGVPAGNFYAWLMVALSFSAVTRWLRARDDSPKWQLTAPVIAYAGLLLLFIPYIVLALAFFPGEGNGLQIFTATALIFAAITVYGIVRTGLPRPSRAELWPLAARLSFHAYFLAAIFVYDIHTEAPTLLVGAIGMIAFEAIVTVPFYWRSIAGIRLVEKGKSFWQSRRSARQLTSPQRELRIDAQMED